MNNICLRSIMLAGSILLILFPVRSQISISGPNCVKPGSEYHYNVERHNQGSSNYQLCVAGGRIKNAPASCISQSSSSVIKIIWNNANAGSITINSNGRNQSFPVHITSDVEPGEINATSVQQLIQQGSIPDTLKCSEARKGNCSPSFSYQWQLSLDKITWQNIANATGKNLKFTTTVNQPTYYRRKVTEVNSGTVKYSGIASVYVIPGSN